MKANSNREQIISLMEQADNKIQIAVSWLTDEYLIEKMIKLAEKKNIQILLSCDPLNAWCYNLIRELQKKGATVLKTGSEISGSENFMHAKLMILDDRYVYGGSNNYTKNSLSNMENFGRYDEESSTDIIRNYNDWFSRGIDYVIGFEDPEEIKKKLIRQFEQNEIVRNKIISESLTRKESHTAVMLTDREQLLKENIEIDKTKELLRSQAKALQNQRSSISSMGSIVAGQGGTVSKPHKFYGGRRFLTRYMHEKTVRSYSVAYMQKQEIERKYSFVKCRIENDTLLCAGLFHLQGCDAYRVKIEYRAGEIPHVYITNKNLLNDVDIHVYREGSLCLFYPGDMKWRENTSIAENTIPWIFEWILFYEIYKITGKWEAEFEPHEIINTFHRN